VARMKLMINGAWREDVVGPPEFDGQPMVHTGSFRDRVTADAGSAYPSMAGRYHLYVSYACPFSHRVIMVRALKQLDRIVDLSIAHPLWDTAGGWVFHDGPMSTRDGAGNGFLNLHEAYRASRADYTGKVTVPVLWDRVSKRIVNNESLEIAQMLNEAFNDIGGNPTLNLYPIAEKTALDSLCAAIDRSLAKGVYAVAAALDQRQYDSAIEVLFGFLDKLERQLQDGRRFLLTDAVTLADVLAFPPLVRFDAVYNPLFRASRRRLVDYPRLAAYVMRLYEVPGVASTLRLDHILAHYYDGDWAVACRRRIVPEAPAVDWRCSDKRFSSSAECASVR